MKQNPDRALRSRSGAKIPLWVKFLVTLWVCDLPTVVTDLGLFLFELGVQFLRVAFLDRPVQVAAPSNLFTELPPDLQAAAVVKNSPIKNRQDSLAAAYDRAPALNCAAASAFHPCQTRS